MSLLPYFGSLTVVKALARHAVTARAKAQATQLDWYHMLFIEGTHVRVSTYAIVALVSYVPRHMLLLYPQAHGTTSDLTRNQILHFTEILTRDIQHQEDKPSNQNRLICNLCRDSRNLPVAVKGMHALAGLENLRSANLLGVSE